MVQGRFQEPKYDFDWALVPYLGSAHNEQLLESYMVFPLEPYATVH